MGISPGIRKDYMYHQAIIEKIISSSRNPNREFIPIEVTSIFGFLDGTGLEIVRPGNGAQNPFWNGYLHGYYLIFQGISFPDGMVVIEGAFPCAMVGMRDGTYASYAYQVYDAQGELKNVNGGYCICDNGYLRWPTMMAPSKRAADVQDYNWSEMLESLRKDIECLFGMMKQEFAILKYGSRFNSLEVMDEIFLTCCAIHNQRKVIAGTDMPWTSEEIHDDEGDLSQKPAAVWRRLSEQNRLETFLVDNESGGLGMGDYRVLQDEEPAEAILTYDAVKQRLITHFDVANKKKEVFWPTRDGTIKNYNIASSR